MAPDELIPVVDRVMLECSVLTMDAMSRYFPDKEPRRYLYDLVRQYPARGGKALRPTVCLAACTAFGGDVDAALPTAVSLEILHNAFFIHDDIQDESEQRRGAPTLHAQHGVALALNAGDASAMLALQPLADNIDLLGGRVAREVLHEFQVMMRHTIEGQAMEIGWRRDNELDLVPDDYLELVLRKTCWYTFIYPLRVGSLIASGEVCRPGDLVQLGFCLGTVFQIADDLENLDVPDGYGKEGLGDLFEGKRTLMLIHLLGNADGRDRERVARCLGLPRGERTDGDVGMLRELMDKYGSVEYARRYAAAIAATAEDHLARVFDGVPPSDGQDFIHCLLPYFCARTW
jgi:geranylgeranyl diphosphate synthase type II